MLKIRQVIKLLTKPILKFGLDFYYRKPRPYKYQGIQVLVHPEVFPPHLTLSTKILLDFIAELDLSKKSFLELGCGSGIISLFARSKEATVTASDINKTALEYLKKSSEENNLEVDCVYSNLFENLKNKKFNYILINPPYYPKKPRNIKEQAWFCGDDFQYFKNLFNQLSPYMNKENQTYMILSEDCELKTISKIALENKLNLKTVFETSKMGEKNTIYQIIPFLF
ncbi:MAG: methyltransferase [Flavobacteriales bacterium]|jgi:release factor glutamine methyltransferase|tara:strand:- start:258 stop:935 length:678 start_codon:yes stop_codon:yes gene_type:complete